MNFTKLHVPKFSGNASVDNIKFMGWRTRARIYLSECEVPERQKYKALYMAVTGEAGEILETHPTKTTEDIFAALEGAYFNEKQKAVKFLSLKQNVGERVRIYYQRVRGQIAQLNMQDSAASRIQADALTLKFFVSGVLPYIAAQFKILRPTELNDAVIKAEQCEDEYILENPKTKHENKSSKLNQINSSDNEASPGAESSNLPKTKPVKIMESIHETQTALLEVMRAQPAAWLQAFQTQNQTALMQSAPTKSQNQPSNYKGKNFDTNYKPYINTQASRPTTSYQNGPSRQSSLAVVGACFHCGRKGHSFRFCRNISSSQLADLTKKQPQLIINEINRLNSVAESQPSRQTSA